MNENYISFYEKQDRENVYSAGLEAGKHRFCDTLLKVKSLVQNELLLRKK